MKEVKRIIGISVLLLAAILAVSCLTTEEMNIPEEKMTSPETPGVSDIHEDNLMLVGIVETAGTAEDFN